MMSDAAARCPEVPSYHSGAKRNAVENVEDGVFSPVVFFVAFRTSVCECLFERSEFSNGDLTRKRLCVCVCVCIY